MKKLILVLLSLVLTLTFASTRGNSVGNFAIGSPNQSDDDMEFVCRTTAWHWNQVAWFDHDANVFKDKRTGAQYIKIFHNGNRKGAVKSNPEYKKLGVRPRYSCKYMTTADNNITYYFDI